MMDTEGCPINAERRETGPRTRRTGAGLAETENAPKPLLKQASLAVAAAAPDISPEDFLLAVMRDPGAPIELRLQAARIAAPLVQPKPDSADAAAAADPPPAN